MPAIGDDLENFPFLANLDIPRAWEEVGTRFLESGGAVLALGAPDTGKSTLSRYLVSRAYAAGRPVGLVDLDLGQSHLGPPGCLGLGLFPPRPPGEGGLHPEGLYFIGQTSPLGAILEVSVGCRVLADQAAGRGATRVVVNTSGFIQGLGALRLKRAQVELLHPALVLGLQREAELEPLLRGLGDRTEIAQGEETSTLQAKTAFIAGAGSPRPQRPASSGVAEGKPEASLGWPLLRLPVSSQARRRTPEERRAYREERFRRYFRPARRRVLPWSALAWEGLPWGQGAPLEATQVGELSRRLEVEILFGERQGSRLLVLLANPPRERLLHSTELAAGEQVHWLSWPALHWRLVGLLDGRGRTLALALILPGPWDPEALALWTPLAESALGRVRFVKVGKMRLNLQGQELSHV